MQFNEEIHRHKNESEEEKMKLIISHDQQIVELQKTNKLEVSQMQKSATEKHVEFTQIVLELEKERDLLKSERDLLKDENQQLIEDKKLQVLIFNFFYSISIKHTNYTFCTRIQVLVTKNYVMKQNHCELY